MSTKSLIQILIEAENFLQSRNIENPRLNSEFLLSKILKTDRLSIFLDSERKMSESEISDFKKLVSARSENVPLQHLLGSQQFRDLELFVGPGVFIPRPETETLVTLALDILKNMSSDFSHNTSCLDIGTGTGAIPLAIAYENQYVSFDAVEISLNAVDYAKQNLKSYPDISNRINLTMCDVFNFKPSKKFSLITSNPPYIPTEDIASLPKEVSGGDPWLALDGGKEGLEFLTKVADLIRDWLLPGGWFLTEIGDGQGEELVKIFNRSGYEDVTTERDYTNRVRFLIAKSPERWKNL